MCLFVQGRMPFMRAMSMEQRWQDLASLLSLPGAPDHFAHPAHPGYPGHGISHSHYEAQRNVLLHNATLAPPVGDLNSTNPYHNVGEYIFMIFHFYQNIKNICGPFTLHLLYRYLF